MESLNIQLQQFFEWLLWVSIQGSVLIGLIVLVQIVLRGKLGIRWHYLLWVLLLIRLAMPWLPQSRISVFNLVPQSIQQGRIIEAISESDDDIGFYPSMRSTDTQSTQPEGDTKAVLIRFVRMLPFLWLLGTMVLAVYVCAGNFNLWWLVTRERPLTDQDILELLEDCKSQMGIRTIMGVVITDRVKSPALFGFIRPRLLLPAGMLETLSREELRYVFLHELAHLKRRDIYVGYLSSLLQVLHWFNPLIWLAFHRIRTDRELACDALVLARLTSGGLSRTKSSQAKDYGRTIVYLLERFSCPRHLPAMAGILETKSQLKRRIKMIAKFKKTSRPRWAGAMLLVAVLACVVLTNAYVAKADFTFGTPTNLGPTVNSSANDAEPSISTDGLILIFASNRPDGYGQLDLWMTTRATTIEPWVEPVNLGPSINGPKWDYCPSLSPDGCTLYYGSERPGGYGSSDIWVSTRATTDDAWGEPVNLGPTINHSGADGMPFISEDGLELYFASLSRSGGYGGDDIWVSARETKEDEWGTPVNLGPPVNSAHEEIWPTLSADGLLLFFSSGVWVPDRPGGLGESDIWMARRKSRDADWGEPVNLGSPVNSPDHDLATTLSADGCTLYFSSRNRPGGSGSYDLWQAPIEPVVDFNSDGIVDCVDICLMVDHWGTDEPLYDIGPTPLGDGIVDVQDLIVLLEHLTNETGDPNLVVP